MPVELAHSALAEITSASHATPQQPGIVVLLPRGETYRNFVYTGALDQLAEQAELTLLSVAPNEAFQAMLAERFGRALPLTSAPESWRVRILRELLDLAHGRWLWSGAARERWRLRDAESHTPLAWLKRRGKKLLALPFASATGLSALSRLERAVSRRYQPSDHYTKLFRQLRPALVFNSSHIHSVVATQAVQAAQWLGIPTATFIFSWDNLTSQGRLLLPYDYYLVWNEKLREQLLSIYPQVDPASVFVTGTPQFDAHFDEHYYWSRAEFCARVGADPRRPIVFYSTGMPNHVPGEPRIVAGIAAMLDEMPASERPQLLVRVSPKDLSGRFEEMKRTHPHVLFPAVPWEAEWLTPKIEDAYLLTNSIRHCAVGINVGSTISLELCMFDKPVINVGYNPPGIDISPVDIPRYYSFDHYRPVIESGAVRLASSEEEMKRLLTAALQSPQADSARRQTLVASMFGDTLDGRSGARVAECLLALAQAQ